MHRREAQLRTTTGLRKMTRRWSCLAFPNLARGYQQPCLLFLDLRNFFRFRNRNDVLALPGTSGGARYDATNPDCTGFRLSIERQIANVAVIDASNCYCPTRFFLPHGTGPPILLEFFPGTPPGAQSIKPQMHTLRWPPTWKIGPTRIFTAWVALASWPVPDQVRRVELSERYPSSIRDNGRPLKHVGSQFNLYPNGLLENVASAATNLHSLGTG
jgi:hypothetical protein